MIRFALSLLLLTSLASAQLLQFYDVRDLVSPIQSFPGVQLNLNASGVGLEGDDPAESSTSATFEIIVPADATPGDSIVVVAVAADASGNASEPVTRPRRRPSARRVSSEPPGASRSTSWAAG